MSSATPRDPVSSATPAVPGPPAADRAYQHVKAGLLDGSYPDGDLLSEGEVANALQMSRTPVREAFLRLQTEGFLRLYPKRGALVVPVTPTEARAVVEARLALETFAIEKLAMQGRDAMAAVGEQLAAHPACDAAELSDAGMHEADRAFHATLVAAAGNPVVADLYNALRDKQMRITATARTHAVRPRITQQHAHLASAIRDGDPELAKARLRKHLLGTVRAFGVAGGPYLDPESDL
ncbi:GntR family transcriptional regulator [Saccharopolyspora sp. ASAGF58]|uniref:GntR family transcriptional regulator n=1 Tax=Saccharopolyspora sp. ASAGF58 TaxID=2719023 RepID=UPI001FF0810E|nr:GntR family transcriptional regulator [Saccharopolyspora sp. ASAGF58]